MVYTMGIYIMYTYFTKQYIYFILYTILYYMVHICIYIIHFTILYSIVWANHNFITILILTGIWIFYNFSLSQTIPR